MAEVPHLGEWELFVQATEQAARDGDPVGILMAEHEWLRSIIAETDRSLDEGASLGSQERREQQAVIWGHIDSHIRKEEEAVFPALDVAFADIGRTDVQSEDMYGEHDAIRMRYEQLQDVLDAGKEPDTAYRHLWRALTIHFDNEEEYLFYPGRHLLSGEPAAAIVKRMQSDEFEPHTSSQP